MASEAIVQAAAVSSFPLSCIVPQKPQASLRVGRVVVVVIVGVSGAVRPRHTRSDCRQSQADKSIKTLLFLVR